MCACALFFTINNQCSFPIHSLLTEAIETCGGSVRLVKILHRLVICAISETALRYVQYRIEKRVTEGIMRYYPCNCFMMASADNIDYIHHYARVSLWKTAVKLAWNHYTIQPKPLTVPIQPRTACSLRDHSQEDDQCRAFNQKAEKE